jgi:hypothetical protein
MNGLAFAAFSKISRPRAIRESFENPVLVQHLQRLLPGRVLIGVGFGGKFNPMSGRRRCTHLQQGMSDQTLTANLLGSNEFLGRDVVSSQ